MKRHSNKGYEMERSRIALRMDYLFYLGSESASHRRTMIRYITPGQMECLELIAKQIVEGQIPILDRDSNYFGRHGRLLRTLKSGWVSLARKKRLLLMWHALIPRLLRSYYIGYAIRNELRAPED